MKNLFFILVALAVFGYGQINGQGFNIDLPLGYQVEESNDKYTLLAASKYQNGEIVGVIEIKYSDDWSFSTFTNKEYLSEMIKTDKLESFASMMFDNFKIHSKEKLYLKGVGDCFSSIYSGDYRSSGVRITNFVTQFVKNDTLFTLTGSSFPNNFSNEYKSFLKSFDTFKLAK